MTISLWPLSIFLRYVPRAQAGADHGGGRLRQQPSASDAEGLEPLPGHGGQRGRRCAAEGEREGRRVGGGVWGGGCGGGGWGVGVGGGGWVVGGRLQQRRHPQVSPTSQRRPMVCVYRWVAFVAGR